MKLSAVSSSTFFLINLSDMRLPERARMLNSQTSIIFFYLDQIRKMGGGDAMAEGDGVEGRQRSKV